MFIYIKCDKLDESEVNFQLAYACVELALTFAADVLVKKLYEINFTFSCEFNYTATVAS